MKKKYQLYLLYSSVFLVFLGISLVIPVLPSIMNELDISGAEVGYLTAAFAFTQLIFSPFTGRAADKFGRKIAIVIGLFIFAFSELLFGLGKTIEVLFVSRMLGGLAGAFIMPAVTAFIVDITTVRNRARSLGYMTAAINFGFIIGPGIGGVLAEVSTRLPFFVAAVLGLISALLSVFMLEEPKNLKEVAADKTEVTTSNFKKVFTPIFFIAFLVIFVSSFGLAAFESFFSLYFDRKLGFTPTDIAIAIAGGAIIGTFAQIVLFEPLTRRYGELNIIRVSIIYTAVLVFAMTFLESYWGVMAVAFVIFIGFDLIRPAVTTFLSHIAEDNQGFAGGMNSFFTSLANVIGPVIAGILFDMNLDYPYYFSAIILVIGFLITVFFWRDPRTGQRHSKV
ncbi:multidrug resistance protein 1 [Jeotgalicoccus coquinae]|jgi:MFS transporter, DHA1 family, multidrug resistance protein|uniref:Quinolone resistance protein NorA n=3 Tax=Jeotgalicoccus TaxID=227979 RepID=A0A078M898_9STAP|nr:MULTISPECIES: tetracycline resistance MFS efflux pump [Jeotgalicoccus]GGE20102.1 multidrug resistance protein 1 [Jeotgalicoccus coquinae]CAD2071660.1 Tetracycline resistance protein, class B [Jeotgalicoccus coquinae]CEA01612.1 Tetracycline resistance protein, class B [Jeotgalicoccus saudimassiliensis]